MAPSEAMVNVESRTPRMARGQRDHAWLAPIEAYRRLRAAGMRPALLDGAGAHPHARYAFIACNPVVEVRLRDGIVEERHASGLLDVAVEAPIATLARLAQDCDDSIVEEVPFTGGWIGLLGFGLANALEPTLPPPVAAPPFPDAILWKCLDVVAFDRHTGRCTLHVADPMGVDDLPRRLDALQDALSRTAPDYAGTASAPMSWTTSLSQREFEAAVEHLKELVVDGDLFQANLATRFLAPLAADLTDLFERLQDANPSPYMALFEWEDGAVLSASPEQLLRVRNATIQSRPIAGTRKRGSTPAQDAAMEQELRGDAKEQAEHTMLVDLVRNDVAKVSVPGTVRVTETGSIERYSHVMHLASLVEGRLRPGTTLADWIAALFPGGTVTGAPKVRATQRILEAEPVPRGFYTGSAGYLSLSGNAEWNILIRTLQRDAQGAAFVHAGSGIVADSDPAREWHEANRKARALLDAASGPSLSRATRLGEVVPTGSWSPPARPPRHQDKRVLLIDNMDSFVHNLADYCASLGAAVKVVRNDAPWRPVVDAWRPTHVILSPGPGWPKDAGSTPDVARALHGRIPILGVCLGHQALGDVFGGHVQRHPGGPVHGKPDAIEHGGGGLFAGLPSPIAATRYHSLIVDATGMGPDWVVDARLADGTVMALRHRTAPTYGLQFHPESLCTPRGLELLDKFLESTA